LIIVLFSKLLLGKSQRFEDFGAPQVFPALSLLVAWIIVGACIIRGVKSSGKVRFIFKNSFCIIELNLGSLFYSYFSIYSTSRINYSKCIIRWSC
jgi:hypothetical protein